MKIINNWQDLPFSKYLQIINLEQSDDDLTNAIQLLAILTSKEVAEVEKMRAKDFTKLASNLEFLKEKPDTSTSKFKWKIKNIDDLTMDNFIEYEGLKNDQNTLPPLLSMMSGIPIDDINKMSTIDVLQGFFLLKLMSQKFINRSARSLLNKVNKMKLKKMFQFFRKK